MINRETLALMKPSAYLINTARGELVEEDALAEALRERRIAGAGLDVFGREPPDGSPLLGLDNVLYSPHIAGVDQTSLDAMAAMAAENVVMVLRGEVPPNKMNGCQMRKASRNAGESSVRASRRANKARVASASMPRAASAPPLQYQAVDVSTRAGSTFATSTDVRFGSAGGDDCGLGVSTPAAGAPRAALGSTALTSAACGAVVLVNDCAIQWPSQPIAASASNTADQRPSRSKNVPKA